MRVTRTFISDRPREEVFDELIGADPPEPPESPDERRFAQTVEHDRPRFARAKIATGAINFDQTWRFEDESGGGTRVVVAVETRPKGAARALTPMHWYMGRHFLDKTCELAQRTLAGDDPLKDPD